jgi:hypothetical protein
MLKKALLFVAVVLSLPVSAAEPESVVLGWTLIHNGDQVNGYPFLPVLLDHTWVDKNSEPHRYNKSVVQTGKALKPVRGEVFSGIEFSLKPHWANGVVVDYNIRQSHLEGFTKSSGTIPVETPNQRLYEAKGTSRTLAVGETENIRLTCDVDIPLEKCPYYFELTLKQVK